MARTSRFEREADKASAERSAAEAAIARDVALAWIDRYYADVAIALIRRADGRSRPRDRSGGVRVPHRPRRPARRLRRARVARRAAGEGERGAPACGHGDDDAGALDRRRCECAAGAAARLCVRADRARIARNAARASPADRRAGAAGGRRVRGRRRRAGRARCRLELRGRLPAAGTWLRQHDVVRREHSAAVGSCESPGPRRRRQARARRAGARAARGRDCARTSRKWPRCSRSGRTTASASRFTGIRWRRSRAIGPPRRWLRTAAARARSPTSSPRAATSSTCAAMRSRSSARPHACGPQLSFLDAGAVPHVKEPS